MARKIIIAKRIRLSDAGSGGQEPFDVSNVYSASFSAKYNTASGASWSTAVITLERTNQPDPMHQHWSGLPTGSSTTITADTTTADLDVSTAAEVRARVSTAQADAGYVVITMVGLVSTALE